MNIILNRIPGHLKLYMDFNQFLFIKTLQSFSLKDGTDFFLLAKHPAPRGEQLSKPKLDIPKLGLGNEEGFENFIFRNKTKLFSHR